MHKPAPIVISMGDPCGIGPEVTAKAWSALRTSETPFVALGDPKLYPNVPVQEIQFLDQAYECFGDALPILAGYKCPDVISGKPDPRFASTILQSIDDGVQLVKDRQALALVTAPIAKSVLLDAGFQHPGHTEYLGALLEQTPFDETRGPIMMLTVKELCVVPVTIHCALAKVAQHLSIEAIVQAAKVTAEALKRDFKISNPRLAVSGLNPHAGEDGAFGDEEERLIKPAIGILQSLGINAMGPFPADSLFHAQARQNYDAVICMYHDQALIPIKTIDFWSGVNVTLGLPIVRTSPDHGTAFEIAGKGIANPLSMIAAIKLAAQLGHQRQNA